MFVMHFYEGGHVLTSAAAHFIPDVCRAHERRASLVPAECFIQCRWIFMLEAAEFVFFLIFNLEAARMCQWEVTRQEVGASQRGCVGKVSLV